MIQNFLKFLMFSFIATVSFVVYYHHQVIILQNLKKETKNLASNLSSFGFAKAVENYKKMLAMKAALELEIPNFEKALKRFKENASQDLMNQLYQVNSVKKAPLESNDDVTISEPVSKTDPDDFESAPKIVADIKLVTASKVSSTENLLNPIPNIVLDFQSDPKTDVLSPDSVELVQDKAVPDIESAPKHSIQPDPENVIIQAIIKVKETIFYIILKIILLVQCYLPIHDLLIHYPRRFTVLYLF